VSLRGTLTGARVLDLYAGSGAVGLEALSRGAAHVLLVEAHHRTAQVVRANVRILGLPGAQVVIAKTETLVATPPAGPAYDVVFLDPPYALADGDVASVLDRLRRHGWAEPGAVVAVERATRGGDFCWPRGYDPLRSRRYGDATLWYAHRASPDPR
jgi:16S rRNA (guanine966-N2)-methyltransferase